MRLITLLAIEAPRDTMKARSPIKARFLLDSTFFGETRVRRLHLTESKRETDKVLL